MARTKMSTKYKSKKVSSKIASKTPAKKLDKKKKRKVSFQTSESKGSSKKENRKKKPKLTNTKKSKEESPEEEEEDTKSEEKKVAPKKRRRMSEESKKRSLAKRRRTTKVIRKMIRWDGRECVPITEAATRRAWKHMCDHLRGSSNAPNRVPERQTFGVINLIRDYLQSTIASGLKLLPEIIAINIKADPKNPNRYIRGVHCKPEHLKICFNALRSKLSMQSDLNLL